LRKRAGVIDGETYLRFAEGWGLENKRGEANLDMPGEHGDLASYSYTFDGLEWESGGSSPIVWMGFTVSEPVKTDPEPTERELAFVSQGSVATPHKMPVWRVIDRPRASEPRAGADPGSLQSCGGRIQPQSHRRSLQPSSCCGRIRR
jgi:hypothetical protein